MRNLVVVLGDQLDQDSAAFDGFDSITDAVWMAEVAGEATHVWSHKARIAVFLSAMRAFRQTLLARNWTVHYSELGDAEYESLDAALSAALEAHRPEAVVWVSPGEWRLAESMRSAVSAAGIQLDEREDRHFYCTPEDFSGWAEGRKSLTMEYFYRWIRRREGVLMQGDKPVQDRWNFDADNRKTFDARGPGLLPAPLRFEPDELTRSVLDEVAVRFPDHPGSLDGFGWPVNAQQAREALDDFIEHRLEHFGRYQDAMWSDQPWLHHSLLSVAMNLKLISARNVVDAAVTAWRDGRAPLGSVEGFVRQIIGWREYVRGVYWLRMPDYAQSNALDADAPLPAFYWTGDTDLACMKAAIGQTLQYGYAHHIQRLMVTGLFALLLGVRPQEVHAWYLAIYVDAVEWVELPNVIGMSQYADGGVLGSKPYCATGKYIQRMSNYCDGCRYRPDRAVGEDACPFTTLYWDFLQRHRQRFEKHPRTALQWRALSSKSDAELAEIRAKADVLREALR